MNIGGGYTVYKKMSARDFCNYFLVVIQTPCIRFGKKSDDFGDSYNMIKLKASTEIAWVRSSCHWYFSVRLLGFGFYVKRQWDY